MQLLKIKTPSTELNADCIAEIADNLSCDITIAPSFEKTNIELKIGKNCKVNVYIIIEQKKQITENKSEFSLVNFVGESSTINTYSIYIGDGNAKIINNLSGPNSSAYDLAVFSQSKNNNLKVYSLLRHSNQNTKGNILVKGIVKDQARVKIDGMIKIDQNGGGAESFLSEHIMLLSPTAHASANPELEIENNDVSSRHAATVAQIDEEKIFYLMSRGISREDSKKLIVEGFLEAAVVRIPNEEKRKFIWEKLKKEV